MVSYILVLLTLKSIIFFNAAVWDNALYRAMHALMEDDIRLLNTPTSQAIII